MLLITAYIYFLEFPNDKIPNFKFLHAQVNLLTQPLLFGGIVQYRFETKSKGVYYECVLTFRKIFSINYVMLYVKKC